MINSAQRSRKFQKWTSFKIFILVQNIPDFCNLLIFLSDHRISAECFACVRQVIFTSCAYYKFRSRCWKTKSSFLDPTKMRIKNSLRRVHLFPCARNEVKNVWLYRCILTACCLGSPSMKSLIAVPRNTLTGWRRERRRMKRLATIVLVRESAVWLALATTKQKYCNTYI